MCIRDRTDSVDWSYEQSVVQITEQLKKEGYLILGVEQTNASVSLSSFVVPKEKKLVIIFGNEVKGLSEDLLPQLDQAIEIPQYGTKHSFNVAVCAGMVLWELSRQLRT